MTSATKNNKDTWRGQYIYPVSIVRQTTAEGNKSNKSLESENLIAES